MPLAQRGFYLHVHGLFFGGKSIMRVVKRLASFVVTPLLLVTMAIGLFLSIHNRWDFDLVIACTLVLTVLYVHVFENIIPVKPQWGMVGEDLAPDIFHFIALIFFSVLGNIAALSLTLHLHGWLGMELGFWNQFAFIPLFIVASVIGEFIPYWYHRISHIADIHSPVSLLLWRMHSIHHLPRNMNWRKTNWMHPINTFLNTFTKMFPLLFIGFSKDIVFAVGMTNLAVSYLSHANILAYTGVLDYVIATPRVHHFHHSTKMAEAKNYANVLPLWDLVFGTYFNNRKEVDTVGLAEGTESEYPAISAFGKQMQFPFRRWTAVRFS
jgi:sterol desaturase/sphingolipid hydroxylase (fatty acid hydroxylase superfamily)